MAPFRTPGKIGLFSTGRRCVGGCIALIGVIMILPSLGILLIAEKVYGTPTYDNKGETILLNGTPLDISIDDKLRVGYNYDIKMEYTIEPIKHDPPTSTIAVQMNSTCTNTLIASTIDSKLTNVSTPFNESTTAKFDTYVFETNLEATAVLNFTFTVLNATDIESISIRIRIYENPKREQYARLQNIGVKLMIPGIIVIMIGACCAGGKGSSGKSSSGRRTIRA